MLGSMKPIVDERAADLIEQGWWTGVTWPGLLDRAASTAPEKAALVDPSNRSEFMDGSPRSLSWAQLADEVRRVGAVLHSLGVRRGDVVGVQLPNSVELPVAMLAIARLGALVCPFPVQYRRHELVPMCELADVTVFVTATRAVSRRLAADAVEFSADLAALRSVAVFGPADSEAVTQLDGDETSPEALAAFDDYVAGVELGSEDFVTIIWTSGTEGFPKGVPRTYGDWEVLGGACGQSAKLDAADVFLNPFPMVNGGGLAGMFVPWLLHGSTLVQHHPFDLAVFCREIENHRVTYTCAPPPVLNAVVSMDATEGDLSSLRVIGSGSAPMAGWMIDGWERGRGVEVLNMFGSNEGGLLFSEPETVPDPSMRGRLYPRYGVPGMPYRTDVARAMSARLVDLETGEVVDRPGQPGELRLKGPAIFVGYLDRGRQGFDEDGWFCTGDVFEISAEDPDLLVHVDRAKDLIIRGGFKISAAEIEAVVSGDPRVGEVAAVASPDPNLGERLCLFVVTAPGVDSFGLEDAVEIVRTEGFAKFKWPERLELVDALPRNPVGKVLKRELRRQLQAATTTGTESR
jgi:acyl-CoA synthetase (AMP-forming)/AMP-acid ligase II